MLTLLGHKSQTQTSSQTESRGVDRLGECTSIRRIWNRYPMILNLLGWYRTPPTPHSNPQDPVSLYRNCEYCQSDYRNPVYTVWGNVITTFDIKKVISTHVVAFSCIHTISTSVSPIQLPRYHFPKANLKFRLVKYHLSHLRLGFPVTNRNLVGEVHYPLDSP